MSAQSHVLISGTGRAGTTFLVQPLTELGFDTGNGHYFENCRAGLEHVVLDENAPFIVRSHIYAMRSKILLKTRIKIIKHLIIPIRDLYFAAESRRNVQRFAQQGKPACSRCAWRPWGTTDPLEQEAVLAQETIFLGGGVMCPLNPHHFFGFSTFGERPYISKRKINQNLWEIQIKKQALQYRL